ncbi:hypothetical protein HMPREF9069_01269 [Atopobium sp. oral taxon 810 str. F0209]|nr:hypothetical protein HMPREF9069_01269 [Atopobium sp. oral taxon 810 str. F0209]
MTNLDGYIHNSSLITCIKSPLFLDYFIWAAFYLAFLLEFERVM